jgi:hypothetical protein
MKYSLLLIGFLLLFTTGNEINAQVSGCNDPLATNYNASATQNDGSCKYSEAFVSPASSVNLPDYLNETSGLIYWNQKIWTHNDDTDIKLYSFKSSSVNDVKSYSLPRTVNNDWEDISQDFKYLYIGDFGNNKNGNRSDLKILRVDKNSLLTNNTKIDTISFRYSLQNNLNASGSNNTDFDCEAFIVSNDSIYLFTKEWVSKKTSVYVLPKIPGKYVANYRDKYDAGGLITGATFHETKKLIVLTGYSSLLQPFLILLYDYRENDFFSGNKRKVLINAPFHQVEGICSETELKYFISNESRTQSGITIPQKLHQLDLSELLGNYISSQSANVPRITFKTVSIYPNPANTTITVNSPKDLTGKEFVIYDIFGREVLRGQLKSENTLLDLTETDPGFYIVCINGNIFKRLIIK